MKDISKELRRYYDRYAERYPSLFDRFSDRKFVLYLYAIFTFLVVAFFGFVIIRPTVLTIFTLQQEHIENEDVVKRLDAKLSAASSLRQQVASRSTDISALEAAIPASPEIPELIRKIELLASEHALSMRELDVGSIEIYPLKDSESPFFSFPVTMTVEGSDLAINSFLSEILQIDRLLALDRVSTATIREESSGAFIVVRGFFYNISSE